MFSLNFLGFGGRTPPPVIAYGETVSRDQRSYFMNITLVLNRMFDFPLPQVTGVILIVGMTVTPPLFTADAATAPSLGAAQGFAVLAGSTVTSTGSTVVTGDLGLYPGSAVTGFPPATFTGTIHVGDTTAQVAQGAVTSAYDTITSQACNFNLAGQDLGGMTLFPGVYCLLTAPAQLTGQVTLDAGGNPNAVWLFRIGSSLTTAGSSSVQMLNGGQSCNVFWQVGSSATLGAASSFVGTLIAMESITFTTGANLSGRALARNAAVTLDADNIAISLCALPSLTVIKSVQTFSDPVNETINPKIIPGSVMLYTMQVVNSGAGVVDNNTMVVTDVIPANTAICVTNSCSNPPVTFICSSTPPCGLTYAYGSSVTYSNQPGGGAPYAYTPAPDAYGFDSNITGVRGNPSGWFSGVSGGNNSTFSLMFKVKVK